MERYRGEKIKARLGEKKRRVGQRKGDEEKEEEKLGERGGETEMEGEINTGAPKDLNTDTVPMLSLNLAKILQFWMNNR